LCLIVFAYDCHPDYQLILGANRDEYRDRPADKADYWSDAPHILAGRDKRAGGTWLGVTTEGKFAAITNYRDPHHQIISPPSRGQLVTGFLQDPMLTPFEFQGILNRDAHLYDGFNLLYGTSNELHYFTNRGGSSGPLLPGIHGLSNHLLDTRWPKVSVARSRLKTIIQQKSVDQEQIFTALYDQTPFDYHQLPDTGIGPERERLLSPIFITDEDYGTCSTTVVMIDRSGRLTFSERVFDRSLNALATQRFSFLIHPLSP
jgi:uncharacterized protein with NRDE domain